MRSSNFTAGVSLLAFAQASSAGMFTNSIFSCPSVLTEYLTVTVALVENATQTFPTTTTEIAVQPWPTTIVEVVCQDGMLRTNKALTITGDHYGIQYLNNNSATIYTEYNHNYNNNSSPRHANFNHDNNHKHEQDLVSRNYNMDSNGTGYPNNLSNPHSQSYIHSQIPNTNRIHMGLSPRISLQARPDRLQL